MESKVPSLVQCEVFRPTNSEFSNFKRYIEKLEEKNLSFAKVSIVIDCYACEMAQSMLQLYVEYRSCSNQ